MQAQLTTDIGEFKAGRVGTIVESPMANVQLIDHNEDPSVPEWESCEDAFDYWFEPVLASNESAALRGTKIPVTKNEIKFLGGTMDLDRNEVFQITREVNLFLTGHDEDVVKFQNNNKRSGELSEQNPEQFAALKEELIGIVRDVNNEVQEITLGIIEMLELPEAISDWTLDNIEGFINNARDSKFPELVVSTILNTEPTKQLFVVVEKVFLGGE